MLAHQYVASFFDNIHLSLSGRGVIRLHIASSYHRALLLSASSSSFCLPSVLHQSLGLPCFPLDALPRYCCTFAPRFRISLESSMPDLAHYRKSFVVLLLLLAISHFQIVSLNHAMLYRNNCSAFCSLIRSSAVLAILNPLHSATIHDWW